MLIIFKSSFQSVVSICYTNYIYIHKNLYLYRLYIYIHTHYVYMLHTNYRNFKNKSQSIPAVLRVEFSFRFLFISFNIKVSNFYSPALQPYKMKLSD